MISRSRPGVDSTRLAAALLFALAGCSHRSDADRQGPPSPSAPSATPPPIPPDPPPPNEEPAPAPPSEAELSTPTAEAQRSTLRRLADDRALAAHERVLHDHFGAAIPFPLALQSAPVAGGGRAILFQSGAKDHNPFVLVLDEAGQSRWVKERPLAGIAPGVTEMALIATRKGDVVLTWYDGPSKFVAARHWDAQGSILADYPLFQADPCAAVSGLYWPGHGFVIAAATAGTARVQLLTDDGQLAFGADGGAELPFTSRADAPVAIVVDSGHQLTLLQAGYAGPARPGALPDHLLAARFDSAGKPLWAKPLIVGPLTGGATDRLALTAGPNDNIVVQRLGVAVTPDGSVISIRGKHP